MKLRVKFQRIVTKGTRVRDGGKFEGENVREGSEKKGRVLIPIVCHRAIVKVCLYNPPIKNIILGAKSFYLEKNYISITLSVYISAFRIFLQPRSVSQNREETWTVQFSSFELLEASLLGWNYAAPCAILTGWILLFQTTPLGGLSRKCWPKLIAKGKGERRDRVRQRRDSANCLASSVSLHSTLQFPILLEKPINFIKTLLAELTKLSWFKPSRL